MAKLASSSNVERQCGRKIRGLSAFGERRHDPHIKPMSHKGTSPRTLDLFEHTLIIPTLPSGLASVTPKPLTLAGLSDAELAQQLGRLLEEVQRRLKTGRGQRPELEAAARQASLSLKGLAPNPPKQGTSSRSSKASAQLQEGHRKAVRAALLAGVAPNQVAKHFGLSVTTIRRVLDESA